MPRTPRRCDAACARRAQIDAVLAAIRRRFGAHSIRAGAAWDAFLDSGAAPLTLPTGSLGLDLLVGGLPTGKLTEYAGADNGGVEALGIAALAACQQAGGLGVLVDPDATLDPDVLVALGVDSRTLLLACPQTAAEAWTILLALARSGGPDLLLIASLSSLLALPRGTLAQDSYPTPRLHHCLGRLAAVARGRRTAILLINGVPLPRGHDREAPMPVADRLLAPHVATRVTLSQDRLCYTADGQIASLHVQATVTKHHGCPLGPVLPLVIGATGPRRSAEYVALGLVVGCIASTGLGLVYDGQLLGRSRERAAALLETDAGLAQDLAACICRRWRPERLAAQEGRRYG